MKKILSSIFLLFFLGSFLLPLFSHAQAQSINLYFFYSQSCPHCRAEEQFLDSIESKYPEVSFKRYVYTDPKIQPLLMSLLKKHSAERFLGSVPMTFINDEFFLGFDNKVGIGAKITKAIESAIQNSLPNNSDNNKLSVPFLGELDASKYSLPALSVVLGLLDGFNVCSLGALVFILGLVLVFKSRRKTLLYGGLFIATTAAVYGALMFLWYRLFSLLALYLNLMHILVGLIAFAGGFYFWKQFIKFRKHGPNCEAKQNKWVDQMISRLNTTLSTKQNVLIIIGSIFIFTALLTIIEFPCSAAVPLVFTGILSQANLTALGYSFAMLLYLFFYMLDELVVFLVAFLTMKLWLSTPKITLWITLIEAVILTLLGIYYVFGWLW